MLTGETRRILAVARGVQAYVTKDSETNINKRQPTKLFDLHFKSFLEWIMEEDYSRSGIDIDPLRGFDYKGTPFPSQMALETGVSVHDYVHVFRVSILANYGAFGYSSYPEIPLSLAREERSMMTIFCALNGTISQLAPPRERLLRTQPLAAFGAPFSKDKAIQQVERLIRCRCSKKRLSYPEPNPVNWVLDPLNEAKTAVLRVRTTELMDSLVTDIYQFAV